MKVIRTEPVKLAKLIRNEQLYPRVRISESNVTSIRRAIKAGFSIPPVIACWKTKQVSDGFHRCAAFEREVGPDAELLVEWRQYADDLELLEDAISLQNHGERLQPIDIARCTLLAKERGMEQSRLAACLHVAEDWLASLQHRKIAHGPDGLMLIKGTLSHIASKQNDRRDAGEKVRPLTAGQVQANARASGLPWHFILDQAINILEKDIVPTHDTKALTRIKRLADLTTAILNKKTGDAA